MINWKVRFRNPHFWMSIIPLTLMTAQNLAAVFDIRIDLGDKSDEIMAALTPMMTMLIGMGIVADPTTEGMGDSARALTYSEPNPTTPAPPQPTAPASTPAHMVGCNTCDRYEGRPYA